jgi:hypothetical protein
MYDKSFKSYYRYKNTVIYLQSLEVVWREIGGNWRLSTGKVWRYFGAVNDVVPI